MATGRRQAAWAAAGLLAFGAAAAQSLPLTPGLLQNVQGSGFATGAGGCVLVNNVWNPKDAPTGFAQSILLERQGDAMLPGWNWKAPGNGSEALSMPELVCGDKPWDAPRNLRPGFPFRAGEKAPVVDFDIDMKAEGTYNMTFSLWAVSALPAVKDKISLEIVVWNVSHGLKIDGEKIATFAAGGTTYDLYLEKKHGVVTGPDPFTWPLVQFVAREPVLKATLDFRPFLDELMARGLLRRGHWLTSLELGNEVGQGSGETRLKTLTVELR